MLECVDRLLGVLVALDVAIDVDRFGGSFNSFSCSLVVFLGEREEFIESLVVGGIALDVVGDLKQARISG